MGRVEGLLRPDGAPSVGLRAVTGTRLNLLNGFELVSDGATVRLPAGAQRLVGFLALQRRPRLRGYVAGSLWPETSEERAHANLRSTLWRVQCRSRELVEVRGALLAIKPGISIDIVESELLAHRVLEGRLDETVELSADALALDVLPDWYDDWVLIERERFRQLRLRALDALCEWLAGAGRFADALELGLASLAGEPLRESAHRALVRIHLAEGNVGEALRQYELCCNLLADRLGVAPSRQMEQLLGR